MIKEKQSADNSIRWIVLAGELVMLNLALLTMFLAYKGEEFLTTPNCKRLMVLMTLVYVVNDMQGISKVQQRFVRGDQLLKNTLVSLFGFTVMSILVMWVFRWPLMTWRFMLPFYAFIWGAVLLYRWSFRQVIKWYRSRGRNSMTVVFVGNISIASEMYKQMEGDSSCGYQLMGYFADEAKEKVTKKGYLGKPEEVLDYLEENGYYIHNLYCMLPSSENELINKIIRKCDQQLVRYNHIPDSFNYNRHVMAFELMANTPVFSMHYEPLTQPVNRIIKRVFDIVVSLLFLVLVFPWVYLIFGALIKISSPGPILFKQKRSGLENKEFWCLKFRSMRVNAKSDELQATKDDPRKTAIGEFMRKTSIDELPQFINVLKGEMSIVGPRPHMLKHTEEYSNLISNYMVRHFAKPGITGYAQITGFRGETHELWQMEERIKKDIWYIEHWSFILDIFIIFKTVANALKGEENAY